MALPLGYGARHHDDGGVGSAATSATPSINAPLTGLVSARKEELMAVVQKGARRACRNCSKTFVRRNLPKMKSAANRLARRRVHTALRSSADLADFDFVDSVLLSSWHVI